MELNTNSLITNHICLTIPNWFTVVFRIWIVPLY